MANPSTIISMAAGAPLRGYLHGLTLSTAGASTTFTIAAGAATDDAFKDVMINTSSLSKTTSGWAVGGGAGGMDTGSVAASTWYHVYLIKRPDTGVVDALFSLSASSPTMPANYTLKRRIGSMLTNGSSQWTLFTQLGDTFLWSPFVLTLIGGAPTNGSVSQTMSTPLNIQTEAIFNARVDNNGGGSSVVFSALDETTPSVIGGSGSTHLVCSATTVNSAGKFQVRTNTSSQIRVTGNAATAFLNIITEGWVDTRGKLF